LSCLVALFAKAGCFEKSHFDELVFEKGLRIMAIGCLTMD
jgi:hypothetical protein